MDSDDMDDTVTDSNDDNDLVNEISNPSDTQETPDPVTISEKEQCEKDGGIWDAWGILEKEGCNLPTSDAGKKCTSSSECESICMAPKEAELESEATGTCYDYKWIFGCYQVVEYVIVKGICVD